MRDDHPLASDFGSHLRKSAGNIFVRQPVKSIASHTLGIQRQWNREMIGQCAVAAMKRRIETGDLRKVREAGQDRSDRRQIVGLVKRRQRNVAFQSRQHVLIDPNRPVVVRAAVYDAMPDRNRIDL